MSVPDTDAPVPIHEDRVFRLLVMVSSALGMGGVISSLTLLSRGPHGFEFHWTGLAIPGFVLGMMVSTGYWAIVFRLSAQSSLRGPRFLAFASGIMLVFALVAFLYPIRFIPEQKRSDVVIGLCAAVVVLSTVGYIIHSIVRGLEQESQDTPDEGLPPEDR